MLTIPPPRAEFGGLVLDMCALVEENINEAIADGCVSGSGHRRAPGSCRPP
jgi:hypothetical protein